MINEETRMDAYDRMSMGEGGGGLPTKHLIAIGEDSHLREREGNALRMKTPRKLVIFSAPAHRASSMLESGLEGMAERLARSPPTKANRVQSSAGSPDFRKWESCRTIPLVGGFSRGSPVSPAPPFRRRSILTPITLIGAQDLAVKSRPNLFTSHFVINQHPKFVDLIEAARALSWGESPALESAEGCLRAGDDSAGTQPQCVYTAASNYVQAVVPFKVPRVFKTRHSTSSRHNTMEEGVAGALYDADGVVSCRRLTRVVGCNVLYRCRVWYKSGLKGVDYSDVILQNIWERAILKPRAQYQLADSRELSVCGSGRNFGLDRLTGHVPGEEENVQSWRSSRPVRTWSS
ncbi:hypothetical protein PR048_015327 [Dryococelus australis]|uniref:Uncharacterized protein n=1 Tax=Dryococelus australis TaxID=614101 RepID=A0ABQ9HGM4_9NEOP|nr:hypothetical protein PR048_015327 [Dryococelus australis]